MNILERIRTQISSLTANQPHQPSDRDCNSNHNLPHNREHVKYFEVTFPEEEIGIHVEKSRDSAYPVVTSVISSSPADTKGVQVNDKIVAMEGNAILSYEEFIAILPELSRPLTLTFQRANTVFKREAMAKAAEERSKAWGNSLKQKKSSNTVGNNNVAYTHEEVRALPEETKISVEYVKKREQETTEKLGYNPFKPHIQGSNIKVQKGPDTLLTTTTSISSTDKDISRTQVDQDTLQQVEECIVMIESAIDQMQKLSCFQTIIKILSNIDCFPQEDKYRVIKLHNKVFNSKVAGINGGLELMLSSGFILSQSEEAGNADECKVELLYLQHPGSIDPASMVKLNYVLNRLKQEINSSM